jgi:hypothetical protein
VPAQGGRNPILLSTGPARPRPIHRFSRRPFTFITRSRLALTGKPRLSYKPRDFEQAGNPGNGAFWVRMASAPQGATPERSTTSRELWSIGDHHRSATIRSANIKACGDRKP